MDASTDYFQRYMDDGCIQMFYSSGQTDCMPQYILPLFVHITATSLCKLGMDPGRGCVCTVLCFLLGVLVGARSIEQCNHLTDSGDTRPVKNDFHVTVAR